MAKDAIRIVYVAASSQEKADEAASHPECHFGLPEAARCEADSYKRFGHPTRLRVYKVVLRVHVESVTYCDRRKPPKEKR